MLDGPHCHRDCHARDGLRSLPSCHEGGTFESCGICRGEARLAHRLHGEGKSLEEIRAAVDAEYGG